MLKKDRKAPANKMHTVKEAQENIIYVISGDQIEKTNFYDHVMKSAEETTTPSGVGLKLHVREDDNQYQVREYGPNGSSPRLLDTFDTPEAADDYIFDRVCKFDFSRDDQRETSFFHTPEEAHEEMVRVYAENEGLSIDTSRSIFRHKECARQIQEARYQKIVDNRKKNQERVERIAQEYAAMLEPEPGESYKQTAARLSSAIGSKIESTVFHTAIKIIRAR